MTADEPRPAEPTADATAPPAPALEPQSPPAEADQSGPRSHPAAADQSGPQSPPAVADQAGPRARPRAGSSPAGRFGAPGLPLNRRNPFLAGLLGGLGVLTAYGIFLGLRNAASILVLIFIALFLAIGLNPAVTRLRRWGLPRGPAVTVIALAVVALLVGGIFALVPPLVTQTGQLIGNVPGYIESLQRNEAVRDLVQRYGCSPTRS